MSERNREEIPYASLKKKVTKKKVKGNWEALLAHFEEEEGDYKRRKNNCIGSEREQEREKAMNRKINSERTFSRQSTSVGQQNEHICKAHIFELIRSWSWISEPLL